MPVLAIDHVQIAMPAGREDDARRFYGDILGLKEVKKPEALKGRGGVWFRQKGLHLDLGVDPDFKPARKAHVGLLVSDLEEMIERLEGAGCDLIGDRQIAGYKRIFTHDPFGNRLEFLERVDD